MKNLKQLAATLLLVVITFGSKAQNNEKTNLWKIEGDSIKTSYLFGTIHLLPQKDFKISKKVQNAFDDCNKVALEIDMAAPNFATDAMKSSLLNEGQDLSSFMDEDEYKLLDGYLKENIKVGLEAFKSFKPIALMSVIMIANMKGEPIASYEMTFIKMTQDANKEMEGLETIEDQIKIFDEQPYDEQIDTFIEMIEKPEENAELYKTMLDLYLAEDVDGMYNYMGDFMHGDIEMMKKLLDNRNNNWIPKFAELSKEDSTFYAVGAGHLGGNQGVINLLKKAGYTVTPVLE